MERDYKVKISGSETAEKIFSTLSILSWIGAVILLGMSAGVAMMLIPAIGLLIWGFIFDFIESAVTAKYKSVLDVPGLRIEVKQERKKFFLPKLDTLYVNGYKLEENTIAEAMLPPSAYMYLEKGNAYGATCMINGTHTLLITDEVIMIDDIAIMSDNKIHESRIYEALGGKPMMQY